MLLWSPAFATGHPAIDRQHENLFQRVNDLRLAIYQRCGDEEMRRVLSAASLYVGIHFRMEEALMRECGYPGLSAHQAEHVRLRAKVEGLVDRYQAGQLAAEELLTFLERWLAAHVLEDDRALVRFIQDQPDADAETA